MTHPSSPDTIPPAQFAERRRKVLEALDSDAMLLPAAPPLIRGGDSELPYRPDSELFYLTGVREPGALLLLRGFANEARVVLYVQERDPKMEQWTGLRAGPEGTRSHLGIDDVRSAGQIEGELPGLLAGAEALHFRLDDRVPRIRRIVLEALGNARARGARKGIGPRGVLDPGGILDELRLRKDPTEIEAIRAAVRLTLAGFEAARDLLRPGVGEWEVEAALTGAFRRAGADTPAFAPIVASGPNACILHYIENRRRIEEGELVLIDAGAELDLYGGDITRTFPVGDAASPEQEAILAIVDRARRSAIEAIGPGRTIAGVHRAARLSLLEGLVDIGLLEGEIEALLEADADRPWFPHQTSHWLGLDTHDPGDYVVDGESRVLEPGMVLTVEPGLYLPEPGFFGPVPDGRDPPPDPGHFAGIGVRIEDDVLVTAEGAEVLSRDPS
jgi:Xaa-Pro aminopeptidase